MNYLVTLILNCLLQINHEQSATLGYNIILVSIIFEHVRKAGAGQTIDNVNYNLQRIGQVISRFNIVFAFSVYKKWTKFTVKHFACGVVVFFLDRNASVYKIFEIL